MPHVVGVVEQGHTLPVAVTRDGRRLQPVRGSLHTQENKQTNNYQAINTETNTNKVLESGDSSEEAFDCYGYKDKVSSSRFYLMTAERK